jgi:hypothetical protein
MKYASYLIYLSGPITAGHGRTVEDNVASALKVYWACLRAGVPAFCPHLSAAFPSAFEIDYLTWIAYDYAIIDKSTHVLMLPNWEQSKGANLEKQYAEHRRLPIAYSLDDLL